MADRAINARLGGNGGPQCADRDVLVEYFEGVKCPRGVWKFRCTGGATGRVTGHGEIEKFNDSDKLYICDGYRWLNFKRC